MKLRTSCNVTCNIVLFIYIFIRLAAVKKRRRADDLAGHSRDDRYAIPSASTKFTNVYLGGSLSMFEQSVILR